MKDLNAIIDPEVLRSKLNLHVVSTETALDNHKMKIILIRTSREGRQRPGMFLAKLMKYNENVVDVNLHFDGEPTIHVNNGKKDCDFEVYSGLIKMIRDGKSAGTYLGKWELSTNSGKHVEPDQEYNELRELDMQYGDGGFGGVGDAQPATKKQKTSTESVYVDVGVQTDDCIQTEIGTQTDPVSYEAMHDDVKAVGVITENIMDAAVDIHADVKAVGGVVDDIMNVAGGIHEEIHTVANDTIQQRDHYKNMSHRFRGKMGVEAREATKPVRDMNKVLVNDKNWLQMHVNATNQKYDKLAKKVDDILLLLGAPPPSP
jgi:hypothetical protein